MPEYYYQIKGKSNNGNETVDIYWGSQNWVFPPIFSGKITANNKKEAKVLIEIEYNKKFQLKVLNKDLNSNEFLLNIEEIKEGSHTARLFEKQICLHCSKTFYVIDKYNDHNCDNKGFTFCSNECKHEHNKIEEYLRNQNNILSGNANPVIYKITNRTNNKCYIGKTTQVFTLRWYQHFFHGGNCKFHEAIKTSMVSDWIFEIQEIIIIPENIKSLTEINDMIIEREKYWIKYYNSIENGYNSI